MGDHSHDAHADHGKPIDSELDYKSIVWFGIILTLVTLGSLLAMWWMSAVFKHQEEAKDPPPSPILEAREDPIPPGPRLQSSPPRDMDEMKAVDKEVLGTYGWVDQRGGVARIPVDRAMSIVVEKGLGAQPSRKEPK